MKEIELECPRCSAVDKVQDVPVNVECKAICKACGAWIKYELAIGKVLALPPDGGPPTLHDGFELTMEEVEV